MNIKQIVKEIFSNIKKDWDLPVVERQVYSEQETVVGVWTDGKPLYRKVVVVDKPVRSTKMPFADNVDFVAGLSGVWTTTSGRSYIITFADTSTLTVWAEPTGFAVEMTASLQSSVDKVYVEIQYTKTTDTAPTTKKVPFEPLIEYSTDEKMIGYWVDGKPLYRKMVRSTVVNGAISDTSIANIEHCKSIQWSLKNTMNNAITGSPTYNGANMYYDYTNSIIRGEEFAAWAINQTVFIIIEYTKTTDQGGS